MKKRKIGLYGRALAMAVVFTLVFSLFCTPAYADNSSITGFDANNQICFDFTNSETQQAFLDELNSTEDNKLWTLIDGTNITANEGIFIEKNGTTGFTFNTENAGITEADAIYIETDFVRSDSAGTWDWTYVNLSKNDIYLGLDQGTSIVMGKYGKANIARKTFFENGTGKHNFKLQSYVNFKTGYVKSRMISLDVANDCFYRTFEGYPGVELADVSWKTNSSMTVKNITIKKNPDLDSLFEVISTPLPSSLDKNNTLEINFKDSAVAQMFVDASESLGNGYSNWLTSGSPLFTNDQTNSTENRRGLQMKKGSSNAVLYLNAAPFIDMGSTLYVEAEYYRYGYDWDWFGFVLNDSSSNLYLAKDTGRGGMFIGDTNCNVTFSKNDCNYNFTVKAVIDYAKKKADVQLFRWGTKVAEGVLELGDTFNNRIGFFTNDATDGSTGLVLHRLKIEKKPVPTEEIQVALQAYGEDEWVNADTLTDGMKIKAVANGFRTKAKPYFFAIAVYESNGTLKNVYKANDAGAADEFSLETPEAELNAGDIVKVFAWNANDLSPLTGHIQKTVTALAD